MSRITRALRLRCPNCGEGKLFNSWLKMRKSCVSCGLIFDRGEADYFIGAYTLNLIVAELSVTGAIMLGILLSWPDVPWSTIMYSLVPLALLGPILTFPYSRAIWLALDLGFQPPKPKDFAR